MSRHSSQISEYESQMLKFGHDYGSGGHVYWGKILGWDLDMEWKFANFRSTMQWGLNPYCHWI